MLFIIKESQKAEKEINFLKHDWKQNFIFIFKQ